MAHEGLCGECQEDFEELKRLSKLSSFANEDKCGGSSLHVFGYFARGCQLGINPRR